MTLEPIISVSFLETVLTWLPRITLPVCVLVVSNAFSLPLYTLASKPITPLPWGLTVAPTDHPELVYVSRCTKEFVPASILKLLDAFKLTSGASTTLPVIWILPLSRLSLSAVILTLFLLPIELPI